MGLIIPSANMDSALAMPAIAAPTAPDGASEQPFAALLAALRGEANATLAFLVGPGGVTTGGREGCNATPDSLLNPVEPLKKASTDAVALSLVQALFLVPTATPTAPTITADPNTVASAQSGTSAQSSESVSSAAQGSGIGLETPVLAGQGAQGSETIATTPHLVSPAPDDGTSTNAPVTASKAGGAAPVGATSSVPDVVQQGVPGQPTDPGTFSAWITTPDPDAPVAAAEDTEIRLPDIAISLGPGQPTRVGPAPGNATSRPGSEIPTEATPTSAPTSEVPPTTTTPSTEQSAQPAAAFQGRHSAQVDILGGPTPQLMVPNPRRTGIREPDDPEGPPGQAATNNGSEAQSVVRSDGNALQIQPPTAVGEVRAPNERSTAVDDAPTPSVVSVPSTSAERSAASPEIPEPAAPVQAPEPPVAVHQVSRAILERAERGGGEARIHLDPAELGEITIHVETAGTQVRIEIRAERPEAMNLLRNHTLDLTSLLGERGLSLADVSVGLGQRQWGGERETSEGRRRDSGDDFAAILGVDTPEPIERHNRLRAAYNPDGTLSYRV